MVKIQHLLQKKRKKSKHKEKTPKNKKNLNLNSDIEEDEADLSSGPLTTNKLLNEIIRSFNIFNYSDYELKHYFDDNHLNLTRNKDLYIKLKVLCTSENIDLKCVPNSYIIGEKGFNCSMKNHNRDITITFYLSI